MQSPSRESASPSSPPKPPHEEPPASVILVAYPKIVFLYPTFFAAFIGALLMTFQKQPLDASNRLAVAVATIFLGLLAINLVILAFDFPRTTSLTLFFFAVALVTSFLLLVKFVPDVLPALLDFLRHFHPVASASFYWTIAGILGGIFVAVLLAVRFDYWEVRPNELLHHHGFLSNLERFSAPHLRIDKEINDLFEYMLLQSGRLILQASEERRAIVLDNVAFIRKKEEAITRMLGALQVQVRPDNAAQ
jgi:hypothetical protein